MDFDIETYNFEQALLSVINKSVLPITVKDMKVAELSKILHEKAVQTVAMKVQKLNEKGADDDKLQSDNVGK